MLSMCTCAACIGGEEKSFALVSDCTSHSKEEVYTNFKYILNSLKADFPHLSMVKVFSDGCGSQFKKKFNLSNLLFAEDDFGVSLEWHFFCTSHGKSSADGIGAVVKRGVSRRVLSDKVNVYTAAEFVNCAQSFTKKVHVAEICKTK